MSQILRIIKSPNLDKTHNHYTYAHILKNEHLPFYIGLGTQVKKSTIYGRALSTSGRNSDWFNKIKDKNYYVIICSSSDNYELEKEREIEMIYELGKESTGGVLVNISDGGDGCKGYKHTEEHIKKLKERYRGENNPMFGKHPNEETRKRMSESQKGRKHSENTKLILSEKSKIRGYKGPIGKYHHKARKVIQVDPITKFKIKEFNTLRDAAKQFNVTDRVIGKACKEGFKVKNYNWIYG